MLEAQATDGSQFVLIRMAESQAFNVGDSNDLATEIAVARANQAFMKFLDAHGTQPQKGRGIPLAEVRQQLGL